MMTKGFPAARAILVVISMSCAAISAAQVSSDHPNTQGQTPPPSAQAVAATDTLPSGTVLSVELTKGLDAKKSKPNDKVEAKTASDLLVHGQIVVPRNTKVLGHVTEAKAHSKASPGSEIKFIFDRIILKRGREIPLQLTVQAIARPLQIPSLGTGGPDSLGDASTMPGRPPSLAQTPAGSASAATINPKYPDDLNPPPSLNGRDMPSAQTTTPLGATSRGVVGIKGLALNTTGPVSVLTSSTGNVHLESGSQLALRVQ
jgi:hypothetical protein